MRKKVNAEKGTTPAEIVERLKYIYSPGSHVSSGMLNRVSRRLFLLADLAQIKDARKTPYKERAELYARAVEITGECYPAREVRQIVERAEAEDARRLAAEQQPAETQEEKPKKIYDIIDDYFPLVGFAPNDFIEMWPADDLKYWEICLVKEKDEDCMYYARVVVCSPESLTYKLEDEEWTTPRSQIEELYRVNPIPLGKDDRLTKEQRERIKQLRGKREDLDDEDDQILRSTARYKYEKEIYDLEHPKDLDDWSAWQE